VPAVVVFGVVLFGVIALTGCSGSGDEPKAKDLSFPTSSDSPTSTADPLAAPPPTPAQIRAEFNSAIARGDMCAVIEVLDSRVPDVGDRRAVVATYRIVSTSTRRAGRMTGFPADLAAAWPSVVEATRLASVEADRSRGDITDPAIGAQFATSEFDEAYRTVIAWSEAHCR